MSSASTPVISATCSGAFSSPTTNARHSAYASASQRSLSEQMLQSSLQLTASTSLANSYGDCSNRSVNAAPPLSSDAAATKTLLYDYRNRSAGGVSTPRRTSSPER